MRYIVLKIHIFQMEKKKKQKMTQIHSRGHYLASFCMFAVQLSVWDTIMIGSRVTFRNFSLV